jgi:malonate-semialdehyde dehydrogenase (acetylating)/methylmalonate-semialdehyde dehydrogenase
MTTTTSAPLDVATLSHWIGGGDDTATVERWLDVQDPASGAVVARAPMASVADADRAVAAAKAAFPAWRDMSMTRRTAIMFAFRELLNARKEEMAAIVTREHGKVLSDALGEVTRGLEIVEFACGMPHLIKGEYSEQVSTGIDIWSIRQPLGVVAGITPFNFPAMVPMWMIPIALAAGNTFVLKPSEKDPSAANFIAELLAEAGLPDGVFNVLHGDAVAVNRLIEHPDVAAVSSVSSTPVARHIYETATKHGKRVQALGGAKNHMLVLPDADMDLAADAAIGAAFGSAGQRCMAVSVLVAVGEAADLLRPKLVERMAKLTTGPGVDASSEMGPVVTAESRDRIVDYVAQGEAAGAELVVDGRTLQVDGHADGFWVGPTLFDKVTEDMSIYTDEIFGPVLDIVRVGTWDDAMGLINGSDFANGVAIFTNDGGAARRFQHEVEVGMVGINVPIPVPMAAFSFGGWKSSLFGDTHMHGMEGVRFFTRAKAITGRWPDPSTRSTGVDLGFPTN